MKKAIPFLLSFLLLCGLFACAGSESTKTVVPGNSSTNGAGKTELQNSEQIRTENGETLTGKIIAVKDGRILLASEEQGLCTVSQKDLCIFNQDGRETSADELRAGMNVTLTYSGVNLETYPAQPAGVSALRISSVEHDLVGLYMQVIADLYTVDPGLNSDISVLAFDLSKTENLSDCEKEALVYLAGSQYGLETVTGTSEELCEMGYINAETLSFEEGLLVTIEVTQMSENGESFLFHANKWRSGDGAYFFCDCEAKYKNDIWTYTIGAELIS